MDAKIDLHSILGFLHRRCRLVIVVALVGLALASIVILTLTPQYTATALVRVEPSGRSLLPQDQLSPAIAADARIEGEVLLARSDNVLLDVIEQEQLLDDPKFRTEPGLATRVLTFLRLRRPAPATPEAQLQQALAKLATMTGVKRQPSTYLLSITISSANPQQAAQLSNAVANAYIDSQLEAEVQSAVDARRVLLDQINAARDAVIRSDGAFNRFVDNNLDAIAGGTASPVLLAARAELGRLFDTHASIRIEIERLRGSLLEAQGDLAETISSQLSALQAQLQETQALEVEQRQQLRSSILASDLSSDLLTEIYDLQQQAELARQQYDQLLQRSQQLQAEASLQMADSRIVAPALVPSQPSSPRTGRLLAMAALASLGLGVLVALVRDRFIGGINSAEQLAELAGKRMALSVPKVKTASGHNSAADLLSAKPLSAYSEAIRRIRTSLDNRLGKKDGLAPVVVVTSPAEGDGKSTTAMALARSYAIAGKSTLLMDCDLRRPSLHEQLGFVPARGLIDALEADDPATSFRKMMVDDSDTRLVVLVGSRQSTAATDQLIGSQNFGRLMHAARQSFDIVIIDTPPLAQVVDGLYLSQQADAVLFIVKWAGSSRKAVRQALLLLEEALKGKDVVVPVLTQEAELPTLLPRRQRSYYSEPAE